MSEGASTGLEEALGESRQNLPLVADPESSEEWKYLRPKGLSGAAAGGSGLAGGGVSEEGRLWVRDEARGYVDVPILRSEGDSFVVKSRNEELKVPRAEAEWVNPVELEMAEDMSSLVALSRASVLHNLRQRYRANLIHTYSGLFCISVNPWKRLPIYSPQVVRLYKGQQLGKMPPHVFAVADQAYNTILEGGEDQSILITGDSGAGKTENTKKILFYLAQVAGRGRLDGAVSLEEQIMQSNPVLEAFGNAKTVLNDNSSRFGKFTKIRLDVMGKVAGAEMESYLLEKSRVHAVSEGERSYHIFYQLCSNGLPELRAQLGLDRVTVPDFRFLCGGMWEVDTMDDAMDMVATDRGMSILGFAEEEKLAVFKVVAGVLLLGQINFMQRSQGDQAFVHGIEEPKAVAAQLGINVHKILDAITSPTIRVGEALVQQSRNLAQVLNSVNALAKALYDHLFVWLIRRCNASLRSQHKAKPKDKGPPPPERFIGVLDIAGFEIFPVNSFEQLCINLTNERLQQFFNQKMFAKEQEEYVAEEIAWEPVDYALQLQPAIDLIERPLTGLLAMLEEECFVPKGSEDALLHKLHAAFADSPVYAKTKPSSPAHFAVRHYAGLVEYSIDGWLEKNKDPLSEAILQVLVDSSNPLLREIWTPLLLTLTGGVPKAERKTSTAVQPSAKAPPSGKVQRKASVATGGKKSGSFATVGATHKEQLGKLIAQLNATQAYFVRCLVPNRERRPGQMDAQLVLHQLKCNGVLEGIRIAKEGYPNRLPYDDVGRRYRVLDPQDRDWLSRPKDAAQALLAQSLGLAQPKDFQLGKTKVFFRAGVLGELEKRRMDRISEAVVGVQAHIAALLQRAAIEPLRRRAKAVVVVQRNVGHFARLLDWPWWRLWELTRPMGTASLSQLQADVAELESEREAYARMLQQREEERKRAELELAKLKGHVDKVLKDNQKTLAELEKAKEEKDKQDLLVYKMHEDLSQQEGGISELRSELGEEQNRIRLLIATNQQLQDNLGLLERSLARERESREQMNLLTLRNNANVRDMEKQVAELQAQNRELTTNVELKGREVGTLSSRIADREDIIYRLREIVKRQQKQIFQFESDLAVEREERRKAEKVGREASEKLSVVTEERDRSEVELRVVRETLRTREAELARATGTLEEERKMHEEAERGLRGQHSQSVAALQDQLQAASKANLRIEAERATLESVLQERRAKESESFGSLPRPSKLRRNSSASQIALDNIRAQAAEAASPSGGGVFRKTSMGDPLNRRLDALEKEAKVAQAEKLSLNRELEALRRRLEEERMERESYQRMLKSQKDELGRLSEELSRSERGRSELESEVRRAKKELSGHQSSVTNSLLEQRQASADKERRRLEDCLRDKTTETTALNRRLSQAEGEVARLTDDLRARTGELRRAQQIMDPTPILSNGSGPMPQHKLFSRQNSSSSVASSNYTNGY